MLSSLYSPNRVKDRMALFQWLIENGALTDIFEELANGGSSR
jgi:hypothetical protein